MNMSLNSRLRDTFSLFVTVLVVWCAAAPGELDAIEVFSDRAAFTAASGLLPVEGFENGSSGAADAPLSSNSDDDVFSHGEILPGIVFQDVPGPGTLGIFNHPGDADGNLRVWLELLGDIDPEKLNMLAEQLTALPDVLSARRSAGVAILPTANLEVTFAGGVPVGERTDIALGYNLGPGVIIKSFAVPEP